MVLSLSRRLGRAGAACLIILGVWAGAHGDDTQLQARIRLLEAQNKLLKASLAKKNRELAGLRKEVDELRAEVDGLKGTPRKTGVAPDKPVPPLKSKPAGPAKTTRSKNPALAPKLKTGTALKRTYEFKQADKTMEYCLYLPKAYTRSKPWPLMVALHGLHSSPWQIMHYPGLTAQAEKHGFVVVAPMGYNNRGWYGSRGRTMRRSTPENLGELSEKDVMNVLAITRRELNIDNRRIYLMGHSMGGGGTWHLGIKYPRLWAGLAPIAPAIFRSPNALAKIKSMPVILVQGEADRLVPVAIARLWAAKMKQLKMDYTYIVVAGGDHVRPAIDNIPKIFEFLSTRKRKTPAKPVAAAPG